MKKIQSILELALITGLMRLLRILPTRLVLLKGKFLGLLFFYLIPVRKSVSLKNIASVFPEKSQKEIKAIARNTYIQFGQSITEFMHQPALSGEQLLRRVSFDNPQHFETAFKGGKGAIIMSGHFGNWEIMAAAISAMGYPVVAIAREQRNPFINKIINDIRRMAGIETLQLGMALRGVLRSLRQNNFVALLADQDAHDEGVFVDFLGRPSSTAQGPAIFCLKTGAPMIFGSCIRQRDGNYKAYIQNIKTDDLDGLTEENIKILTQRHAAALEESIKKWPDHWFWMHKRWKTRPKA